MTGQRLRLALLGIIVLMAPFTAAADGLRFGAQVSSGSDYGTGVGGRVEYDTDAAGTLPMTLALSADNFFPSGLDETYVEFNANLLYTFYNGPVVDGYAGAGFGLNRHRDPAADPQITKNIAINLLAGLRVATGTPFVPFGEFRLDLAGQYVLTGGVLYALW